MPRHANNANHFLSNPPPSVGPLPPDLLAAYNGAVWPADNAGSLTALLTNADPQNAETAVAVEGTFDSLRERLSECKRAVEAVAWEFTAVREGPFSLGNVTQANAHEAGIEYAEKVLTAIRIAADPSLAGSAARMNSSVIRQNFPVICKRMNSFQAVLLPGIFEHWSQNQLPRCEKIVAAIQWEATHAAARRLKTSLTPPLTEPQADVLKIIKAHPQGIMGTAIIEQLRESRELAQSTLTRHIIPVLKAHHGVKNKPGAGYFVLAT